MPLSKPLITTMFHHLVFSDANLLCNMFSRHFSSRYSKPKFQSFYVLTFYLLIIVNTNFVFFRYFCFSIIIFPQHFGFFVILFSNYFVFPTILFFLSLHLLRHSIFPLFCYSECIRHSEHRPATKDFRRIPYRSYSTF